MILIIKSSFSVIVENYEILALQIQLMESMVPGLNGFLVTFHVVAEYRSGRVLATTLPQNLVASTAKTYQWRVANATNLHAPVCKLSPLF